MFSREREKAKEDKRAKFFRDLSEPKDQGNAEKGNEDEDEQGASIGPEGTGSTKSRQNISAPPRFQPTPSPKKK